MNKLLEKKGQMSRKTIVIGELLSKGAVVRDSWILFLLLKFNSLPQNLKF